MRCFVAVGFGVGFGLLLGCTGLINKEEEPAIVEEAVVVAAPLLFEVTPDVESVPAAGVTFATMKAGTTQGMVVDMTVALVGPAPAVGGPQPVVGSARVTEVTADSARLVPLRLASPLPASVAARALAPEDSASLSALPEVAAAEAVTLPGGPRKPGGRPGPWAGPGPGGGGPAGEGPGSKELAIPADLRTGSADEREDALVRHEDEPGATAAIVWVMKNDTSSSVRFKAWRVIRARWNRGTGAAAEHEAAALWLAANGSEDQRIEAIDAVGENSRSIEHAASQINDLDEDVRVASVKAVGAVANRTGKRDNARDVLTARRDKEGSSSVRKKIDSVLDKL
ncbi:hypothetical protein LBMAG42_26990 [Deltaproteobacteria bacterium]|nr:hypothetical protein LBMAG42_26990 [Deltaproteobacteria bacterium]